MENEEKKEAGGIYLFSNETDAKRYLEKHTKRLESFGYKNINAKIFKVNEPLSKIKNANFVIFLLFFELFHNIALLHLLHFSLL